MTVKRYIVQPVEGVDGIEKASDSPVGRRRYGPGDVIELDDTVSDVAGIMARGQIVELVDVGPEPVIEEIAPKGKGSKPESS